MARRSARWSGRWTTTDLPAAFAAVEDAALAELGERRGAATAEIARYAELRYAGQEHTLEVPVPDPSALGEMRAAFERRCLESYSFRLDAPLEVVVAAGQRHRAGHGAQLDRPG